MKKYHRHHNLYKGTLNEQEERSFKQVYQKDGRVFPTANVTDFANPILKRFGALCMIQYDLGTALELINHYKKASKTDGVSNSVLYAIWSTVMINYAKCYNKGEARGPNLNAKDVFKNNEKLKRYHNSVIDARNKYFAHTGDEEHFYRIIKVVLNLENRKISSCIFSASFSNGPNLDVPNNDADRVEELVRISMKFTEESIERMKPKITNELEKRFDELEESWEEIKKLNNKK